MIFLNDEQFLENLVSMGLNEVEQLELKKLNKTLGRSSLSDDELSDDELYAYTMNLGNAKDKFILGWHFMTGCQVRKDRKLALSLVQAAADTEEPYPLACIWMAQILEEGVLLDQDLEKSGSYLKKSVEFGNPLGQYYLGDHFLKGRGIFPKDETQALTWFTRAAEGGNSAAMLNVGRIYLQSKFVAHDYQQAVRWITLAAQQPDNDEAQCLLGQMYVAGLAVKQDFTQAIKWLTQAANHDNAEAQGELGMLYYQGRGLAQDDRQALMRFSQGAEQEDALSLYGLGLLYIAGKVVKKDLTLAKRYIEQSAKQGLPDAQAYLSQHTVPSAQD